jgi:tRNA-Thr(GGU) m(6)t(6)A37 methyltransferase TsaA
MDITYRPIGTIHSPFTELKDMPIQPTGEASAPGWVEISPEFADGLRDLDGFSHLILIYHLHKALSPRLTVTPFLDEEPHGIFATRAPTRPNPIGLSVVKLVNIEGTVLRLASVDILDGTPLLDIKPYVPGFDAPDNVQIGWLEQAQARAKSTKSDSRFTNT